LSFIPLAQEDRQSLIRGTMSPLRWLEATEIEWQVAQTLVYEVFFLLIGPKLMSKSVERVRRFDQRDRVASK
jgi:putative hemolysin